MPAVRETIHAETCTCQAGWVSPECAEELRSEAARLREKVEYQARVISELESTSETLLELRDSLPDVEKAVAAHAQESCNGAGYPNMSLRSDRVTVDVEGPTLHGEAVCQLPGWQECGLPFSARLVAQVWEIE